MGEIVHVTLKGPDALPGRIAAADVAKVLLGYERAVARAAEVRVRRSAKTGRRGASVESTTRLIYRSTRKGSFVVELELPDIRVEGAELDLDFLHLGASAARDVQRIMASPETAEADPRVIEAIDQLVHELDIGGASFDTMKVSWPAAAVAAGKAPKPVVVDRAKRDAIERRRHTLPASDVHENVLTGVLVEADFEKRSARLLTTDNQRISVSFDDERADLIHQWLRRQGELRGLVEYTKTGHIRQVELRAIERSVQHDLFDTTAFWNVDSIESLADAQGVEPIADIRELAGTDITDEEFDAFLLAINS